MTNEYHFLWKVELSQLSDLAYMLTGVIQVMSMNDKLTNLVIDSRRMSFHSLIRNVGNGSNRHDLVGDLLIIFAISS